MGECDSPRMGDCDSWANVIRPYGDHGDGECSPRRRDNVVGSDDRTPGPLRRRPGTANFPPGPEWRNGRRSGLKIHRGRPRASSTLASGIQDPEPTTPGAWVLGIGFQAPPRSSQHPIPDTRLYPIPNPQLYPIPDCTQYPSMPNTQHARSGLAIEEPGLGWESPFLNSRRDYLPRRSGSTEL